MRESDGLAKSASATRAPLIGDRLEASLSAGHPNQKIRPTPAEANVLWECTPLPFCEILCSFV